ncbi:MAG: hypothetical protein EOP53_01900 [Sphingobacteriales bacterium]|nr:MAG: hypothetical protein EOP53_01900 [Sphingobacteriales bacterium]
MTHKLLKTGDVKQYRRIITEADAAVFENGMVHPVYATFALARDAEWACRQFVLEIKAADEEGIGTYLTVNHFSPALIGEEILFKAMMKSIKGNEIICSYEAKVGERLIASGETGQKILKRSKLDRIFASIAK